MPKYTVIHVLQISSDQTRLPPSRPQGVGRQIPGPLCCLHFLFRSVKEQLKQKVVEVLSLGIGADPSVPNRLELKCQIEPTQCVATEKCSGS